MSKPLIVLPRPTSMDHVYNRKCLPAYMEAIRAAGGEAMELGTSMKDTEIERVLSAASGIVLPGSPADVDSTRYGQASGPHTAAPDAWREEVDRALLSGAERGGIPVLGICYGMQSLNVWRGGSLLQDVSVLPVNHAAGPAIAVAHAVEVNPQSLLGTALDGREVARVGERVRVLVNSSHHQAVGVQGDGLRVSARSPEDGVVEAVEGDATTLGFAAIAVQWHPERSIGCSAMSRNLFDWLLKEAQHR